MTGAPDATAVGRVQEAIAAAEGIIEAASQDGARFVAPLAELLEVMKLVLRITVSCVRPASSQTLPSVASTLAALVQATETAAQKVLDETDALCATQDKLRRALAQLESVGHRSGAASRAWQDARGTALIEPHGGVIVYVAVRGVPLVALSMPT